MHFYAEYFSIYNKNFMIVAFERWNSGMREWWSQPTLGIWLSLHIASKAHYSMKSKHTHLKWLIFYIGLACNSLTLRSDQQMLQRKCLVSGSDHKFWKISCIICTEFIHSFWNIEIVNEALPSSIHHPIYCTIIFFYFIVFWLFTELSKSCLQFHLNNFMREQKLHT